MHLFLYTFPEFSLLSGILNLCFLYFFEEDTARSYTKTARFWLIVSLFFSIIFYDKSFNVAYFENNAYTLLWFLLIDILTYIMLGLSSYWFSSEKKTGCKYNILILCALIGIRLMLSAINLLVLFLSYVLLICINYRLLGISYEKKSPSVANRYMGISAVIILGFFASIYYLNNMLAGNIDLSTVKSFFSHNHHTLIVYMAAAWCVIPFFYSLGIAPFHIMAEDKVGQAILPVSHYFAVIMPLAFWGIFIKLNMMLFNVFALDFAPVYQIFAVISLFLGAIGANARINLHRIYAHGAMYHFGLILLLLSFFKPETDFAAFICLFVLILGINGIYMVFYSLKSHGGYLSAITSLSGLAETRPYTTGTLLISLFSLIGLPPLAGFIGQLNMVNELIENKSFIILGIVFALLLFLVRAYLEIIKTVYFEHKIKTYDTEKKNVLFYTLLSTACMIAASFNPYNIFATLKDMFYVIFI